MSADWNKHAALLDMQPSNRRLVQSAPASRWQSADLARMTWSDQVERGAGFAGLIVWGVVIAGLLWEVLL